MPATLILDLARVSRRFIVSAGTRKARAISSVVSPATARSVSATCASMASAGWQHMKTSSSRSSGIGGPSMTSSASSWLLREQGELGGQHAVAAQPVDGPVPGRGDQPGAGIVRHPGARPALRRDRERLGGGLLGQVEVAEVADQAGQHPAPLVAENLLDQFRPRLRALTTTGRISTEPPILAAGIRAAISVAWSRSSASIR